MQYDPSGNTIDELRRTSPDMRDFLQNLAQVGADFWRANSRVRTGFNARSVTAQVTEDADGYLMGVVYAHGHYARFREHGTRYNAAERVLRHAVEAIGAVL